MWNELPNPEVRNPGFGTWPSRLSWTKSDVAASFPAHSLVDLPCPEFNLSDLHVPRMPLAEPSPRERPIACAGRELAPDRHGRGVVL